MKVVLALLLVPVLFLAGCSRQLGKADFVFMNGAEPETLDPALITSQPESRLAYALFEGLTAFDRSGTPVPGVAENWEISPDGLVYTFHLRRNAKWSNGDPVTTADFIQSWRRALAPETASEYASQLYYLRNGKGYNEGTIKDFGQVGVRAIDPYTLEVTLENPTSFFLDLCAFSTLLPVHMPTVEKYGDDWTKPGKLVGNGPYVLTEWRINDRIRFTKNPYYWDRDNVAMKTVDALPISRANTSFNFYAAGQSDLIMDKGLVPNQFLDELKKRPDFHSAPFLGTMFLRFNCKKPPFQDARVRKAFSLVIDKSLLVNKITRAGEPVASSLTPPGTAGYQPPPGLSYNVAKARELLAQAGYPDGRNFPHVSFLYNEGDVNEGLAVEMQAMFRQSLGVSIDLQRQEWKVYLRSLSSLDYDICRSSWVGDYNDPNTFLASFITDDGNNRTGWSNTEFDHLIADAGKEPDREKRFAIFRRVEQILISEEAPICPIYFYVGVEFYDGAKLGGIQANLLDEHPLKAMYWKDGHR